MRAHRRELGPLWQALARDIFETLSQPLLLPRAAVFGHAFGVKPRDWPHAGALLAINLLFLMIWGFAGLGKVAQGKPAWFPDKFGGTFLAKFPGLDATFWLLAISEVLAFLLALVALGRGEFLRVTEPVWLRWTLAWGLFVFVQLGFGQWLTNEFNATAQLFAYFAGTLVCLHYVSTTPATAHRPQPAGASVST